MVIRRWSPARVRDWLSNSQVVCVAGASVVVLARREPELLSLADEITVLGGRAGVYMGNVVEENFAREMVEYAVACFRAQNTAINNAGIFGRHFRQRKYL